MLQVCPTPRQERGQLGRGLGLHGSEVLWWAAGGQGSLASSRHKHLLLANSQASPGQAGWERGAGVPPRTLFGGPRWVGRGPDTTALCSVSIKRTKREAALLLGLWTTALITLVSPSPLPPLIIRLRTPAPLTAPFTSFWIMSRTPHPRPHAKGLHIF